MNDTASATPEELISGKGSKSHTESLLLELESKARHAEASTKLLFKQLKRKTPRDLDIQTLYIHDEIFEKIDCLECANCCRSLGPRITDNDIQKLSKALKIKPGQVIDSYLRLDEEGDYVFQQMPCPFLMNDNHCMIYESRPKACREYPHTNRKRFEQAFSVTLKNTHICPAAYLIVEKLKTIY
jgi:hypothetical protein